MKYASYILELNTLTLNQLYAEVNELTGSPPDTFNVYKIIDNLSIEEKDKKIIMVLFQIFRTWGYQEGYPKGKDDIRIGIKDLLNL